VISRRREKLKNLRHLWSTYSSNSKRSYGR